MPLLSLLQCIWQNHFSLKTKVLVNFSHSHNQFTRERGGVGQRKLFHQINVLRPKTCIYLNA